MLGLNLEVAWSFCLVWLLLRLVLLVYVLFLYAVGAEFLDMKSGLSDLIETWRGHLLDHMTTAIFDEANRNGVDLTARGFPAGMLAETLLDRLDGIKARTIDPEAQRQAARIQIKLIDTVLKT